MRDANASEVSAARDRFPHAAVFRWIVVLILAAMLLAADLDRGVSSAARLSQSSGARVCACAPERSALFVPAILQADWGAYPYLGMDASLAVLARIFPIETAGRVYLSLCILALPAAVWFFLRQAQPGCGSGIFVVAADRLQRFFSRRIFEFRSEHCRGAFGAWIMAAMACEAGNRPMGSRTLAAFTALYFTHLLGFGIAGLDHGGVSRVFTPANS